MRERHITFFHFIKARLDRTCATFSVPFSQHRQVGTVLDEGSLPSAPNYIHHLYSFTSTLAESITMLQMML
jgi:hypothetical protein